MNERRSPRAARRHRGAASVEYAIATMAVIVAVFVPLPGFGVSAFELALDALRRFQAHSTYLLSLP